MDEKIRHGLDDLFSFDCHKGLACFTRCCRDINLFLTPYDILRLKNGLSLHSRNFLDTYTTAIYMEEVGHPLVVMNMVGDEKRCPFATPEGCQVYTDRPWSCRIFPLEPYAGADADAQGGKPAFSVLKRPFCLGFKTNTTFTVKEWLERQGTARYEEMNALWAKVTLSPRFPARGLAQKEIQMFFLASYSLDEFATLASRQGFLDTYGIKSQEIRSILRDETLLYTFACRWLQVTLLGEKIALMPDGRS